MVLISSSATPADASIVAQLVLQAERTSFLENTNGINVDNGILWAFFNNCVSLLQNRERDVRYFATTCLAQLSRIEHLKKLCLMQLIEIMNKGSSNEKIAVLNKLYEEPVDDDAYMQQIVNAGKADSNYIVRYVALREK